MSASTHTTDTDSAQMTESETLQTLVGYWTVATRQERLEYVRLFVLLEGLAYDLRRRIAEIQPRPAFLRPLLALADWREHDGVLHAPHK